jgi:hypothetical protein
LHFFLVFISLFLAVAVPCHAVFKDDFLVNGDCKDRLDEYPSVGFDSAGNFVVHWHDLVAGHRLGWSRARWFNALGSPMGPTFLALPDTMTSVNLSTMAVYPDGRLWSIFEFDQSHVPPYVGDYRREPYACLFSQEGTLLRGPVALTKDLDLFPMEILPFAADLSPIDDRLVVAMYQGAAWWGDTLPLTDGRIHIVQIDSTGEQIGACMRVDSGYGCLPQTELGSPVARYTPANEVLVTWGGLCVDYGGPYQGPRVWRRQFDSLSQPQTASRVLLCGDLTTSGCATPSDSCGRAEVPVMDHSRSGPYVVTFVMPSCYPGGQDVFAQAYGSQGQPLGSPVVVSDTTAPSDRSFLDARMGGDGHGLYIVLWVDSRNSDYYNGSADLYAQLVDSTGRCIGENIVINSLHGSPGFIMIDYDVAILDSQVVIVWSDLRDYATDDYNLYAQLMELRDFVWFMPGDCNGSRDVTSSDVIGLVHYVFKSGAWPQPRVESGDVNADCVINAVDVIKLVNFVFKAGAPLEAGCACPSNWYCYNTPSPPLHWPAKAGSSEPRQRPQREGPVAGRMHAP